MHITNLFSKSLLMSSLLMISGFAVAHDGHDMQHEEPMNSSAEKDGMNMPEMDHSSMNHSMMNHTSMAESKKQNTNDLKMNHELQSSQVIDESQHPHIHADVSVSTNTQPSSDQINLASIKHQGHDHRKEHGAQIYAMATFDNKWLLNDKGQGSLKSELETRIGTDENKVFIKINTDKHESQDADFEAKVLYSRMISDFWDAQIGTRYRSEKVQLDSHRKDTEEKIDGVIGLHGLAPYFFETEAYLYVGDHRYSGFSLETERDLLLTQQLILKPYLDMQLVFSDDSKYAKKTGLSNASFGLETRYEINKKVMPYIDIAYEYSKGDAATSWQVESDSKTGWLYGAGIRLKF